MAQSESGSTILDKPGKRNPARESHIRFSRIQPVSASHDPDPDLLTLLQQHWGYASFRPKQELIVRSILEGRDAAVVMPTGGGKSLCYQLPAIALQKTCIVISPLIALMQDQAEHMRSANVPAAFLNSSLRWQEQQAVIQQAQQGVYRLLYVSPERLVRDDTAQWLRRVPIGFFAVDEAHCI